MSEYLAQAALAGCVVTALFGSMGMRSARHLDGKLAQFRRVLAAQAVCLVVFAIGLMIEPRAGAELALSVQTGAATDLAAMKVLAGETVRRHTMHLGGLVVVLMANVPMVLHLLRELQSFVLHHRTDLLARDQAVDGLGRG
ncbi:MAG: hypothetical protein MUC36_18870 [Planctomycetes bacterium]|jgi:hypothetical protein|nr:hypothetical protein [Planctomycetota bacterium]